MRLKWRGQRRFILVNDLMKMVANGTVEQKHPEILTKQIKPVTTRTSPHAHIMLPEDKPHEALDHDFHAYVHEQHTHAVATGVRNVNSSDIGVILENPILGPQERMHACAKDAVPAALQAQHAQHAVGTVRVVPKRTQQRSPQPNRNAAAPPVSQQADCDRNAAVFESRASDGNTARDAERKERSAPPAAHGRANRAHTAGPSVHANMPQAAGPTTSGEGSEELPPPGFVEAQSQRGSGGAIRGAVAPAAAAAPAVQAAVQFEEHLPADACNDSACGGPLPGAAAVEHASEALQRAAEASEPAAQQIDAAWQSLVDHEGSQGTPPGQGMHDNAKEEQLQHDAVPLPPSTAGTSQNVSTGGAPAAHAPRQATAAVAAVASGALPAQPTAAASEERAQQQQCAAAAAVASANVAEGAPGASNSSDGLQARDAAAQVPAPSTTQYEAMEAAEDETEAIQTAEEAAEAAACVLAAAELNSPAATANPTVGAPPNLSGVINGREAGAAGQGGESQVGVLEIEDEAAANETDGDSEPLAEGLKKCSFCGCVTSQCILYRNSTSSCTVGTPLFGSAGYIWWGSRYRYNIYGRTKFPADTVSLITTGCSCLSLLLVLLLLCFLHSFGLEQDDVCCCRAYRRSQEMSQRNRLATPSRCHPCERLIRRCENAGYNSDWVRERLLDGSMHTYSHIFDNTKPGKPITHFMAPKSGTHHARSNSMHVAAVSVATGVARSGDANGENTNCDASNNKPDDNEQDLRLQYSPPATRRAVRALQSPREPSTQRASSLSREYSTPASAARSDSPDREQRCGGSTHSPVGRGGGGGGSTPAARGGTTRRNPGRKSTHAARAAAAAAGTATGVVLHLLEYSPKFLFYHAFDHPKNLRFF